MSHGSYSGDGQNVNPAAMQWLWAEQAKHCAAAGVSTFLYWNPSDQLQPNDNAFAAATFAALQPATIRAWPELKFNVDGITTGTYTTLYSDFRRNFG